METTPVAAKGRNIRPKQYIYRVLFFKVIFYGVCFNLLTSGIDAYYESFYLLRT